MLFLMCSLLAGLGALQPADSVLVRAKRVAARFADTSAARAQGFGPFRIGRLSDLTPFQGQHWLHTWHVFSGSRDLSQPSFVMFVPVDGRWKPAGLAYSRRVDRGTAGPRDLDGAPVSWHLHQPCIAALGEGVTLADGEADCRARGGAPRPPEIAMVHAWTGIDNPEGPFAHDNVALPYWVTGLQLPRAADLSTPARARRTRALGMALGESYGAIMGYARLVESVAALPRLADSLDAHRAAIRALVPRIRAAEKDGKRSERSRLAALAVREWEALRRLYSMAAPSEAIRAQLEREHAEAAGDLTVHHRH